MRLLLLISCLLLLCSPAILSCETPFTPSVDSTLIDHDPILVGGNQGFIDLAEEEEWQGTGTAIDPYIVEGYHFYRASHMLRLSNIDLHIIFRDNEFDGIANVWCAIVLDKVNNIVIANNTIHHAVVGVHLAWSNHTTVTGNTMYQISADGVFFDYYCYNNTVTDNEMYESETGVFAWGQSRHNLISGNYIHNTLHGLWILVGSDNNTLIENTIRNCTSHGIYILTSGNIIQRNDVYNNQGSGIYVGSMTAQNLISRNLLYNNTLRGVAISTSSSNIIEENDFVDNHLTPQACDNGSDNIFRDNYWSDWIEPDENQDNYVDTPYSIAGEAGNQDEEACTEGRFDLPTTITVPPPETPTIDIALLVIIVGGSVGSLLIIYIVKKYRFS